MRFDRHLELRDKHAFLSPSSHHWLHYDADKLRRVYYAQLAKQEGIELHELGCRCIQKGVKLLEDGSTLSLYVNDAIDMDLTPEQPLYYSPFCYGTADTIGIHDAVLHIHDLKTGKTKASFEQLKIYAALYFLEYGSIYSHSPRELPTELRIYQSKTYTMCVPSPDEILFIMEHIVKSNQILQTMKGDPSLWKESAY